ncbi:GNAT family N-acetyltransferase [Streptomyces sp. G-G2]|uniref:GNAT family N-acetyltransferase n=1 Tax=Streptomyces sp. G-G2 TaxID=3046201 RepID=UPI0024BA7BDB|nr:GNAT family N-acetyltransferase [Streptomyces sp. G-G2]MDJ0383120.1 GNAT family N-acetyltransferase [Streptomyces sp. G-G2]
MPGVIAAARVDLVPLGVGHAAEMAGVLADPALHRFIGGEPAGPDALRARYARQSAGSPDPAVLWGNWVLLLRGEGRLVGAVQATVEAGTAEVAWVIGTPWQGRGLATEAARALVAALTTGRPAGATTVRAAAHAPVTHAPVAHAPVAHTVVAHVHPDHHASAAVASACGLAPTSVVQDGEVRWRLAPPGQRASG